MAFQLSPGVLTQEQDATNVVPAVATTVGGIVGDFSWGPAREIVSISSENNLVSRFGKPSNTIYEDFLTASSFLAYGSSLLTVREVGSAARNAVSSGTAVLIRNDSEYEASYSAGEGAVGMWAAKYPGITGNSIKVSFADYASFTATSVASVTIDTPGSGYGIAPTVTFSAAPGGATATALGTAVLSGDGVSGVTITYPGIGYTSAPTVTFSGGGGSDATATAVLTTAWTYAGQFDYIPLSTTYSLNKGVSLDELHIAVIDNDGSITGIAGTVIEKFEGVSKASDARDDSNGSNYYKDVINNRSQYIRWMDHPADATATRWGNSTTAVIAAGSIAYGFVPSTNTAELTVTLGGGLDASPSDGDLQAGYDLFANDELVDVNLILTSGHSQTVSNYAIDNVSVVRKDCLTFVSPLKASVVNNVGSEVTDTVAELSSYTNTSYAVMDSGWKYMYDKYNDQYRWVPLNGDIAGCCVGTDEEADPWFSPAGYSRGQIKNAVKLAYSPTKSQRDSLYSAGINPVVGFPGNGIVLFGDKTMVSKASAFNRINVRRLFITVEKAIATAAKFQLFEFNDAFTRAQFKSLVEPFLRDVQGRRGIYDFRVVCDETNNTAAVIDSNEFRADIYIKPAKSINFITLTFVATRTGISFDELGA